MIGLGAMGLVILDNPSFTALLTTCAELRRSEFLLTCAPYPSRAQLVHGQPSCHFLTGHRRQNP